MSNPLIAAIGIAWYRQEDYAAIRKVMSDRHVLPNTYAEWREKAERLEREQQLAGRRVVRAIIDPKTFPDWCRERGLNVDAKGRMAFGNDEAYRQARS